MNIKEKAAYVKGLISGLELEDTKEKKVLNAIVDWMDDISISISNLDEDVNDICDQLDILDEDLADVEEEVFEDECGCDCGSKCDCEDCDCECDCDDDCCCGCNDDAYYEIECPSCGERVCLSEDALLEEKMDCPNCGELLEFDIPECCGCECGNDCEDNCGCDCHCGESENI